MSTILTGLNPEQTKAVTTVQGPVLVLAGPGSGKTRVLTRRIAFMIDEAGIAPWHILAVTFTNKAAGEMRTRVEKIFEDKFGPPPPGQPPRLGGLTIGTFHSICARILRVETAAIGFEPNWVIYDTDDQLASLRQVMEDMQLDEKKFSPKAVLAQIGKRKNSLITADDFRGGDFIEGKISEIYRNYQEQLRQYNAMDFDDLLLLTVILLRDDAGVRAKYQDKWQYLLVDEFQDTNIPQYQLLKMLGGEYREKDGKAAKPNLFVVGDEDQSIYRFRGADYGNVELFRQDFPKCEKILLEQNYRSTQTILDIANTVISRNENRTPKRLFTVEAQGLQAKVYEAYNEVEEAAWVADEISRLLARRECTLSDIAVTYRANWQSRIFEDAFMQRGITYRLIGATRFYERKEIKDALAYLRLIYNPTDGVALERIINVPPRKIGAKTFDALRNWAHEIGECESVALMVIHHGRNRISELLGREVRATTDHPELGSGQLRALANFSALLENWIDQQRTGRYKGVVELLDAVLNESSYAVVLRDGTEEGEERFQNLQELRSVAAEYVEGMPGLTEEDTPLSLFLQNVALVSDTDALDSTSGAVTLLTLHSAKGLEFHAVFVVGLEEKVLPHSRSMEQPQELKEQKNETQFGKVDLESAEDKKTRSDRKEDMAEERRLFYVGVTRAKRRLYLSHAFLRTVWGSTETQIPSRFLLEIPEDLLTGMVDKRGRREDSARRMTSWDETDQSLRLPRSQTGGQWSGRSKSTPWPSSSQPDKKPLSSDQDKTRSAEQPKQAYWSPGASQPPINRKSATGKPAAPAPTKFNRRDSVQHPSFGVGTVIESVTSRDGEEVTVAFPGVGIKKLLAEYLKKL